MAERVFGRADRASATPRRTRVVGPPGVMVRFLNEGMTPGWPGFSGPGKLAVATFWSNDIKAVTQIYPDGDSPWCPSDGCTDVERVVAITRARRRCGHNGHRPRELRRHRRGDAAATPDIVCGVKAARPSTRAIEAPPAQDPFLNPVVSVVVGKNMKDIFYDFDNIQSDDWGWGAAAACVTSRPARARERRLPQKTTPQVSSTPLTRTPRTRDACRWANPEIGTRGRRRNLSVSTRRSPFGLILAVLDCGRRPRSNSGKASTNTPSLKVL